MPINYDGMPYKKQVSIGEKVRSNTFYRGNLDGEEPEESRDIFRGYDTYNFFGSEFPDSPAGSQPDDSEKSDDSFER